jgi:hypothetical protein
MITCKKLDGLARRDRIIVVVERRDSVGMQRLYWENIQDHSKKRPSACHFHH